MESILSVFKEEMSPVPAFLRWRFSLFVVIQTIPATNSIKKGSQPFRLSFLEVSLTR